MFQFLMSSGSFSLYGMMYYELQPVYKCRDSSESDSNSKAWQECKPKDFCVEGSQLEFEADYSNDLSIHNWVDEYGM